MDLRVGSILGGRFELRGELGRGAVGTVYRAREVTSGREVALKVLAGRATPTQLERFEREAALTASLSHPGIVRVHTAGSLDGVAFIAYELVEGCATLEDLLARGALDLDGRVRLVIEVARAVGFAHARGVLHRDVKPANVLVDAAGRARVADFGLATAAGLERLTMTGAIVGTPTYMAPEQISGGATSPATDVWALGVMLYEALAGVPPFAAGSLAELAVRVCTQRPPPPRAHAPGVAAALEDVCLRALATAPAARHADALAFADDLERARSAPPARARTGVVALPVVGVGVAVGLAAWALAGPTPTDDPRAPAPAPAPRTEVRSPPVVAATGLSSWLSTRLAPSQRSAVRDRARWAGLAEVQQALDDLERDPAVAPLPALRCAAWLREAREDLAPVDEERGEQVLARWIAEARLARPDAEREVAALSTAYWSTGATVSSDLAGVERLGQALGAALLLGRNPYDVDPQVVAPLYDFIELVSNDTALALRGQLRDDLGARAPSEPLLVAAWLNLCSGREARNPIGLDDAAWAAHRRLLAAMPAGPPAKGWGRAHGELVARLRWRADGKDPGFVLREAARAQAGPFVLRLGAETAATLSRQELDPVAALEYVRQAWAMLERVPADERDELQARMREHVVAVALLRAPAWFVELPADRRPHPVLPPGVSWGERPGEYLRASDAAVLEWVDGAWREVR